jgi:hypothetical protein
MRTSLDDLRGFFLCDDVLALQNANVSSILVSTHVAKLGVNSKGRRNYMSHL